ncbi:MAG: hypothetical protein IJ507_03435 [Clostridia bacterium]|nr:hypothetical protein [Clostridia bacterium]
MNQLRPDLKEARELLRKAKRRQSIRRSVGWLALVAVVSLALAAAILCTPPFEDVLQQLMRDAGICL